jgi:hypothetical protein
MTTTTSNTDDAEALRVSTDRQMLDYRTATVAKVVAFDGDGCTVDVQPLIAMTRRVDGVQSVPLPIIRGVPIMLYGSTKLGLFVCPPIGPGDEGVLVISDRALDNWQHGSMGAVASGPDAESPRHHDITDAMFYPGVQRAADILADYPDTAIQLRNRDGTTVVSLDETSVETKVVGGAGMRQEGTLTAFDGNVTIDGNLSVSGVGGGNMTLSGNVTITEGLTVGGNVAVTGTVSASDFINT